MDLLTAYNKNAPNIIDVAIFGSIYENEVSPMFQERRLTRPMPHDSINLVNRLSIGRNIRILHEIIDCDQHDIETERVKNIFQDIATRITDPDNGAMKGGAKRKRNSSKRANKKKKTIKSKSKRRLHTRKY